MTELLTAQQMRAIEHAAINSGEVTGLALMERAGKGVVEAIFEEWPEYKSAPQAACVLCGPGNNGGDGFAVANILHSMGWTVRVLFSGDIENLPPDAQNFASIWHAKNKIEDLTQKNLRRRSDTLIIDAMFGSGLSRPLKDEHEKILHQLTGRNGDDYSENLVCIDAPSGLCLDSGRALAAPHQGLNSCERQYARLTVTFDSPKIGHFIADGPHLTGKLIVKDIGLETFRFFDQIEKSKGTNSKGGYRLPQSYLLAKKSNVADPRLRHIPFFFAFTLLAKRSIHKYSHGHALICTGPANKTGAARLAARGALRIGSGLVTVASPTNAMHENAAHLTSIMLREADTVDQFKSLLADERLTAVCIGPGFARLKEFGGLYFNQTREMVKTALASGKKVVLDADAITAFQDSPKVPFNTPATLFAHLHKNCVLTPHGGEFKRLFPDIHAKLIAPATTGPAYSKVDATRDAAKRAGCTVLFKGADTVIANEKGRASINSAHYDRAAPWLATAGSGDVLAGFITGLLARGFEAMQAAETAAWLHVECALKFGPGLIAEDIPEQLPAVLRELGL